MEPSIELGSKGQLLMLFRTEAGALMLFHAQAGVGRLFCMDGCPNQAIYRRIGLGGKRQLLMLFRTEAGAAAGRRLLGARDRQNDRAGVQ